MSQAALKSKTPLDEWLAEFGTTLEVFLDPFCIVDISGAVVEFNIAFSELVGESHRTIRKKARLDHLVQFLGPTNPFFEVVSTGRPLRIDTVPASTKANPEAKLDIGAVPIFSRGGIIIGALLTLRNVTADHNLLAKYGDTKRESITDGLTGLFNKTHMEEQITKALKVALREKKPLSIIMADIDHFKKVNDVHGHQAGDYVLKLVASTLRSLMRETDKAGRFGGEEFVLLLHNCTEKGAAIFCERFRKSIETNLFIFEGKRIPVTLSQGTTSCLKTWDDSMDIGAQVNELIHQADSALYQAKETGRNKVVQFDTTTPLKPKT